MKRPQFGIRLMLLVLTWLAGLFAWRNAANKITRLEEEEQRVNRETLARWNNSDRPVKHIPRFQAAADRLSRR